MSLPYHSHDDTSSPTLRECLLEEASSRRYKTSLIRDCLSLLAEHDFLLLENFILRFKRIVPESKLAQILLAIISIFYLLGMMALSSIRLQLENLLVKQVFSIKMYFPEDCIANLSTFQNRLEKKGFPSWWIRLQMLQEITSLFFAFYIRIPFENLFLPSKGSDHQIDD